MTPDPCTCGAEGIHGHELSCPAWSATPVADRTYFHATDADLSPGDLLTPRPDLSRWADCPGYDPAMVYVYGPDTDEMISEIWGRHVYEVDPIGPVMPDPERDPGRWDDPAEDPAHDSWIAPSARVVRLVTDPEAELDAPTPQRLRPRSATGSPLPPRNRLTPTTRWRTEFVTVRGDSWASNALTFDTVEAAEQECRDRAFRWTAVKLGRVVPTTTPTRQPCDYDAPGPVVVDYR